MNMRRPCLALTLALLAWPVMGQVVINEVFYHAPDDLTALQWIELYNNSDQPVDLTGWRLDQGVRFRFQPGTTLGPRNFLVLCKDRKQFQEFYSVEVLGEFENSLKKSGDRLELKNGAGQVVDSVAFTDRAPWPRGPAGHTASLERICPAAPGNLSENWTGSPLSEDETKPGGSPGKQNSSFSASLPPVIDKVSFQPALAEPGQSIRVEARVTSRLALHEVSLNYQVVGPGFEGEEKTLPMTQQNDSGVHAATIPGQKAGQIVRFHLQATDAQSARRQYPSTNDLRPALSCLVYTNVTTGKIPWGYIIHTDPAEVQSSQPQRQNVGAPGSPENQARFMAQMQFQSLIDLPSLWTALTLTNPISSENVEKLRSLFTRKMAELDQLQTTILRSTDLEAAVRRIPESVQPFKTKLSEELKPLLGAAEIKVFETWDAPSQAGEVERDPNLMLKRFVRLEPAYFHLASMTNINAEKLAAVRDVYRNAIQERDALIPQLRKMMAGPPGGGGSEGEGLEAKAMAIEPGVDQKLKAVLSASQVRQFSAWRQSEQPTFMRKNAPKPAEPTLGRCAFIYIDPKSRAPKLYDFVHIPQRSGGWKVHFGKDEPFNGMTGIDLIFEATERWVLAEPLAYELHRRAGLAAPSTDFLRLWVDGQPVGYHLLIEQPNKAFLRRNGLRDDGNLYKANWAGHGLVGQNEKRTNLHSSHDDLVHLVEQLEATKSKPGEQWDLIKRELDVEEVVNHYAVRMLISDWDGFFNNYYLYHDLHGTKRWMFFPWDEDKTWGEYDGWQERPLFDMPLTYAQEGDRPPGSNSKEPAPRGFDGGSWWRPGGYLSKPVLSNPNFRKLFLARIKELLDSEFNEEKLFPLIDAMKARLSDEIIATAADMHEDQTRAKQRFESNLASFKEFITKRRQWLLAQDEIRTAGSFDRTQFQASASTPKAAKRRKAQ